MSVTSYYSTAYIYPYQGLFPSLSLLLSIDLVAVIFFLRRKSYPYSLIIFILLILFNSLQFLFILHEIGSPYLGIELMGIVPFFMLLFIIDIIAVLIRTQPVGGKAQFISYIGLIACELSIIYLNHHY
jgi:hypothetical protein